ncbi:hypothetical protein OEZ86_000172 [Tetradesmus obliquus]|nr:hypothetical protein OEZ86_000172 [Tetradesmus obliquus]
MLKTREGIRLLQLGISPYEGDSCHIPPLWLAVVAPWVQHRVLCVLPNMVCDVVAAAALLLAAAHLFDHPAGPASRRRDAPWLSPQQLSLLYLLQPFAVLACVAGSSTSAENMGVLLAVAGGVTRNAPMAAAGVAVGTYMGLHPALLVVPLLLLMWRGPEDVLQHRQVGIAHSQQPLQLQSCWAVCVYKLPLLLEDYTPNIGLWWYFFTEMFAAFRPFFTFVFHSFAVVLAVPVAIRFNNRPLFAVWVQLFISCMFKPYASVGDMVPWLALLPLLQQQLQCVKAGLFFVNSFVLLLVLGLAMWHQWINVDAANSNFFYSITLLLGVWYTVFLTHLVRLTAQLDRRLAGKRLQLSVDDLDDDEDAAAAADGAAVDAAGKDKNA